ncbi:hypothetical protein IFM89_035582 [Coptis chinensis]|uniref:MSP domain-containing protein n=1 Tax=Coptis chinensis TaxID=261450 RepID=A0A835HZ08_9MAGN|nr:hypothetical protein IFM89_035582 [Coptis chinensis]
MFDLVMGSELLEITPRELKFTFELKKHSSCAVQLYNKCDQYIAFKVKTTSPKKYCVRPNTGIIHPKSTCDFTGDLTKLTKVFGFDLVTMQAQKVAPTDMQCKDKFLIQGTLVPYGTTEEDITPDMFAKDSGRYIDENKLKVVLISPSHSPVLLPINGALKEDNEASTLSDQVLDGVENHPPLNKVPKEEEHFNVSKDAEALKPAKDMEVLKQTMNVDFKLAEDVKELKPAMTLEDIKQTNGAEFKLAKDMEELKVDKDVELKSTKNVEELELAKNVEELKSKLTELEAKLIGAESTISMLKEERSTTNVERQMLQQQLAVFRRKNGARRDQVGFPFLFVCMVALIGVALGYTFRC